MLKVVGFSTNPLKLETRAIHIAVPFIAQRRRRVEKVAQGVSPGYKAKTGSSPGGATQRLPRETLMCRASGARQHSSIFPSAYALGYFMPRLPALFEVDRCILIHLKLLIHATLRWCLGRCVAHSGPQSHRIAGPLIPRNKTIPLKHVP